MGPLAVVGLSCVAESETSWAFSSRSHVEAKMASHEQLPILEQRVSDSALILVVTIFWPGVQSWLLNKIRQIEYNHTFPALQRISDFFCDQELSTLEHTISFWPMFTRTYSQLALDFQCYDV